MRLWHEDLIEKLPRGQLLGQHRECCALRGNGWKKKHATVDYVFTHPYYKLFQYHSLIMKEMEKRGYQPDGAWKKAAYRGRSCEALSDIKALPLTKPIYPEHDDAYLKACLENLKNKGIEL